MLYTVVWGKVRLIGELGSDPALSLDFLILHTKAILHLPN